MSKFLINDTKINKQVLALEQDPRPRGLNDHKARPCGITINKIAADMLNLIISQVILNSGITRIHQRYFLSKNLLLLTLPFANQHQN